MFILPNWPASKNIKAITTTKASGNLAAHVGDDPEKIKLNRAKLKEALKLPSEPTWLNQQHSTIVTSDHSQTSPPNADGSYAKLDPSHPSPVCAVLTADCLPILICNKEGTEIAALHAGWRGLLNGIIEAGIEKFESKKLLAWLGPAIGPNVYEIGPEIYEQFTKNNPQAKSAFKADENGKYLMNIYLLATQHLNRLGITDVYSENFCTYSDDRFYSYRRNHQTGRIASLIYILSRS